MSSLTNEDIQGSHNWSLSNFTSTISSKPIYFDFPMRPVDPLDSFKKYAILITSVLGILGNLVIIYVFTKSKLKRPSTARYLAAIAVADTGYLSTILLINLTMYHKIPIHNLPGLCQVITFGGHSFPFLIRWYLTAVVVEKYIGVMWPRKKSQMCTVFRAKCVIISLAILSIVCYLYVTYFFVAMERPPSCTIIFSLLDTWQILTRMDAVVNFAFPYIIMFILTSLITYRSWQYRKRSQNASERFLRRRNVTTAGEKEFKTTPLLIMLIVCTLALCVPNSVSRLSELSPNFQPSSSETDLLIQGLFHYFEVVNSSIKVFIYSISSTSFARQLANMFCGHCSRRKGDVSELQNSNTGNQPEVLESTFTEGVV